MIQNPIPAWTYLQVRNILLVLADLFESIEATLLSSPNLAVKLRAQINKIDQYMQKSQQISKGAGKISMGQSLLSGIGGSNGKTSIARADVSAVPDTFAFAFLRRHA